MLSLYVAHKIADAAHAKKSAAASVPLTSILVKMMELKTKELQEKAKRRKEGK
jgi:hypothetical protein